MNGWSCGSISNKCNWLPFKWSPTPTPLVLQARLPPAVSCHVWWAEGVLRRNRKWTSRHTHTHTGRLVSPWELYAYTSSGLRPLSAGACSNWDSSASLSVANLSCHTWADGWDVCVHKIAPECCVMVTRRPEVSVFPSSPSPLTGICVGYGLGTFERESSKLLSNTLIMNTRSFFFRSNRKNTRFSNACTLS